MSYVVECVGAASLPSVGSDLAASCASAGGTLSFVENSSALPELTGADAALIAGAIASVWALGFIFRLIRNMIEES